ncbi:GNAT family N-acetyltransferase [Ancylobacter terrae]|uniref:GNAT family N-acetyltransferase n=1 Tax=Ancylobacter sp. sgz301288 TaxID=3342077 RepID=UPI00385C731C
MPASASSFPPVPADASVALRPARADDIPAITAIYAHAVRFGTASFEIDPPDEVEMVRRMGALIAGGYPYIAAEAAGRLIGYAYAGPYRARPAYRTTVENSVYVQPGLTGRGIGRRLLERLVAEAAEAGFRQMIAVIGDSANAASIGLHAAAGFHPVGTLESVGFKAGRWLDTVLMQRPLGPADTTPP